MIQSTHQHTHSRLAGVLLLAIVAWLGGCHAPEPAAQSAEPQTRLPQEIPGLPGANQLPEAKEPMVRVRIETNIARVLLSGSGWLSVGDQQKHITCQPPVLIQRVGNGWQVTPWRHQAVTFNTPDVWIVPQQGHALQLGDNHYAGSFRVEQATGKYAQSGHLDVINHLPMESYLPGVLAAELYSSWPLETFKAQAIAARSYTFFEMDRAKQRKHPRPFDLENDTASQVYSGKNAHDKAVQAVRATQGRVLTWHNQILPAFYSSTCGGRNQYASLVLPQGVIAGPVNSPRPVCRWCRAATYYRWDPISRSRVTLSRRIAAWGLASQSAVGDLGTLAQVRITGQTPAGRPTQFTLTDTRRKSFTLSAEALRFACNFNALKMGKVSSALNMRSSDCQVQVTASHVIFSQGRGFGHGVGLCQWGAQGMAKAGYHADDILKFYYPGVSIKRLY